MKCIGLNITKSIRRVTTDKVTGKYYGINTFFKIYKTVRVKVLPKNKTTLIKNDILQIICLNHFI